MKIDKIKSKKTVVLGMGKEGIDTYLALRKIFPEKKLGIADKLKFKELPTPIRKKIKSDKKINLHLGNRYLNSLKKYDLIIKTPGIQLNLIKPYLKKGAIISSQTEIFLENCKGTVIGVTGTKGKGTCASLIYKILKDSGLNVYLIGNIGRPVFKLLLRSKKNDIFVYELSSHQLQNLKKSCHIAVFTNLYPDHLDYYKNFKAYKKAKANIAILQKKNDIFIYNAQQKEIRDIANKTKAKKIPFSQKDKKKLEKIIKISDIPIKGDQNILNVIAAVIVAKIFKIKDNKIKKSIKSFKPLAHRMEFLGKYKGIKFYNDSLATIPQATELAIDALGKKIKTIILGGSKKGEIDFSSLAKKILKSNIENIILFPETGFEIFEKIKQLNKEKKHFEIFFTDSMREAVKISYYKTSKKAICLLSPASASFGIFKNYKERGNAFKKYVKYYASKNNKRESN